MDVSVTSVKPLPTSSAYLKPLRMELKQNGKDRYWDFMTSAHNSVHIIIYNTSRDVLVLVRQFRPATFYGNAAQIANTALDLVNSSMPQSEKDEQSEAGFFDWKTVPISNGITLELCAGLIDDPNNNPLETAKKEVWEECGYDVLVTSIKQVSQFIGSSMFYVEVTDEMKTGQGGGLANEGEYIEIVEMSIPEVKNYIEEDYVQSPISFLAGMYWFFYNSTKKPM